MSSRLFKDNDGIPLCIGLRYFGRNDEKQNRGRIRYYLEEVAVNV
jgi:hypothetical protein